MNSLTSISLSEGEVMRVLVPAAGEWTEGKRARKRARYANRAAPSQRVRQVVQAVAQTHGYTFEQIVAPHGDKRLMQVRVMAMAEARAITGASYPIIAATMKRDHSTIVKCLKRYAKILDERGALVIPDKIHYPQINDRHLFSFQRKCPEC